LAELLLLSRQARIELAASPIHHRGALPEVTRTFTTPETLCWEQAAGLFQRAASIRPLSVSEGIPAFTTAQFLAAGIIGQVLSAALSVELRQLALPAGVEPATVGSRCNPCLHHAATLESFPYFLTSLLHYFLHTRTPIAFIRQGRFALPIHSREKFREELAFTESGFAPEPWASPEEVPVNFTIPG
jgi:hypothetical protein